MCYVYVKLEALLINIVWHNTMPGLKTVFIWIRFDLLTALE